MTRVHQKAVQKMDIKKGQSQAIKSVDKKKFLNFFVEVKSELKRVEWTSKEELKAYTKIVIACMFAFGFSIYLIDLVIRGCLDGINLFVKFLIG